MEPKQYEPGIYFGMPFDEYTKIPAFNASGIKNLLVSPLDYWARTSMNPVKDDDDEETKAKTDGRAYHKRILEGKEAFYLEYAPDYEDDPTDTKILRTSDDLSDALVKCGKAKTFKKKADAILTLMDADKTLRFLDVEKENHKGKFPGREFISAGTIRHIELSAKMIEFHPELRTYLAGGQPEVTIIWDDEEFGIRFKIRVDYLKMAFGVDLKTFANQMKKPIKKAIDRELAVHKYFIQASLYMRGTSVANYLIEQGRVFGDHDPKWVAMYPRYPIEEFRFIFMQKGVAPVAAGRRFMKDSAADKRGLDRIREACETYHAYRDRYGVDPWIDTSAAEIIENDEIAAYANEL